MNNINNLVESNTFENEIKINTNVNISNSQNEPLKEPEQVALHALLELSLEAALGELNEEGVNMKMNSIASKMKMLKTFMRSQTTGPVNSAPMPKRPRNNNNNFAPPMPNTQREGKRPRQ